MPNGAARRVILLQWESASHCGSAPRREFRDGRAPLSIQRPCRAPLPLLAQIKMTPLHIASAKGEVASALAKAGESPSALRYVREHRVEDVAPAVFLEAAERNGARALASAQKFCASYTRQVV